jgi:hypothetical protein
MCLGPVRVGGTARGKSRGVDPEKSGRSNIRGKACSYGGRHTSTFCSGAGHKYQCVWEDSGKRADRGISSTSDTTLPLYLLLGASLVESHGFSLNRGRECGGPGGPIWGSLLCSLLNRGAIGGVDRTDGGGIWWGAYSVRGCFSPRTRVRDPFPSLVHDGLSVLALLREAF